MMDRAASLCDWGYNEKSPVFFHPTPNFFETV